MTAPKHCLALVLRIFDENHFDDPKIIDMVVSFKKTAECQCRDDRIPVAWGSSQNTAACVSLSKSTISKTKTGNSGPAV